MVAGRTEVRRGLREREREREMRWDDFFGDGDILYGVRGNPPVI